MKRLLVSAAVLPLLYAASAHAETKITTATTAPVKTSTIASGQPDALTIDTAGSITPTVAGAAVTVEQRRGHVHRQQRHDQRGRGLHRHRHRQ